MNKPIIHTYVMLCLLFQSACGMDQSSLQEDQRYAQSPMPLTIISPENPEAIVLPLTPAQQRRNNRIQLYFAIGGICALGVLGIILIQTDQAKQSDPMPPINNTMPLTHYQSRYQLMKHHLRNPKQPLLQKYKSAYNKSPYSHHQKRKK